MILTFKYRVKNLHGTLNQQARAVNFVWNYVNDAQRHAVRWDQQWLSGFTLTYMTAGSGAELGLLATTISAICKQYAKSRTQHRRPWLRYRGRRTLGWVPFRADNLKAADGGFRFNGRVYRVFMSRPIPDDATFKDGGSFSQDARGNWFINICLEVPDVEQRAPVSAVGIDLGLKDLAALSNGVVIKNPRHVAKHAFRLATARRARKKRQARNVHARIVNARRDHLHKASRQIVTEFDYIAAGNVNAAGLAKTRMAKSVLDAGWTTFRNMLRYKSIATGGIYEEVSERFTTQTCSCCGTIPDSSPKGMGALGIRVWSCSDCGAVHDRDTNAAFNILLRSGHRALVEGAAVGADMPTPVGVGMGYI